MVWGGITSHGRTQLVIVNGNLTGLRYRDEIIGPHVQAFIQRQGRNITLQQDNARPHVARVVTDFLRQQNIPVLPLASCFSRTCHLSSTLGMKWSDVYVKPIFSH